MQDNIFKEIDISSKNTTLTSGESLIIENWYDADLEIFCRTVFYPYEHTKDWDQNKHQEFLIENKLLQDQQEKYQSGELGITKVTKNGIFMWSITDVIGDG